MDASIPCGMFGGWISEVACQSSFQFDFRGFCLEFELTDHCTLRREFLRIVLPMLGMVVPCIFRKTPNPSPNRVQGPFGVSPLFARRLEQRSRSMGLRGFPSRLL